MYVFQLFDYYAGSRIILLIAFFECLVIAWIYGADRFYDNLEMMLGFRMNGYMKWCWKIVTPIFTIVSIVAHSPAGSRVNSGLIRCLIYYHSGLHSCHGRLV